MNADNSGTRQWSGIELTRRRLISAVAVSAGVGALAACSQSGLETASKAPGTTPALPPAGTSDLTQPRIIDSAGGRLDVTLTAAPGAQMGGRSTGALGYNGISPGPTLRVRPGDEMRVRLVNQLGQSTNLHTHGLHVSPEGASDNPFREVKSGESFDYTIQIPRDHPAGTYWYHPHRHMLVAEQVFGGLFGALVVAGPDDPPVDADRVIVLSDTTLDDSGNVVEPSDDEKMIGRVGDLLLVNGQQRPVLTAAPGQLHRWRFINTCASRTLTLSLDGHQFTQIAIDGNYLPSPEARSSFTLAPGNRIDVLVRPNRGGTFALMAETHPLGRNVGVAGTTTVAVLSATGASVGGKATPRSLPRIAATAGPVTAKRQIVFGMLGGQGGGFGGGPGGGFGGATGGGPGGGGHGQGGGGGGAFGHQQGRDPGSSGVATAAATSGPGGTSDGMDGMANMATGMFTIDGKFFDPDRDDQVTSLGAVEEWTIVNNTWMAHPFHLHVWPFTVLASSDGAALAGTPQDVVNVPAFGSVRIRIAFDDFAGRSVYHCHILDHGDMGMMAALKVVR